MQCCNFSHSSSFVLLIPIYLFLLSMLWSKEHFNTSLYNWPPPSSCCGCLTPLFWSRDFDPEAYLELEISPDRSKISIRRNFREHRILIRTKIISRTYIMKFLEMIRSLQLLIQKDTFLIWGKCFGLPDDLRGRFFSQVSILSTF